jgi:hypothetical protein
MEYSIETQAAGPSPSGGKTGVRGADAQATGPLPASREPPMPLALLRATVSSRCPLPAALDREPPPPVACFV